MTRAIRLAAVLVSVALVVGACGAAATPTPGPTATPTGPGPTPTAGGATPTPAEPTAPPEPVTITVWDYYGTATPVQPALTGFQAEYPWITVKYEALDWDSMNEKFTVGVSVGEAPDVATLDMTWIPTLASNGVLEGLKPLSGGQLNGTPIEDHYTPGALEAMTFDSQYVTMLFDFDAYALYYRADIVAQKGIAVPKTWDEFREAARDLAEDSDGDGKPDKYLFQVWPDTFHWSQFLFQDGGSILTADNSAAAFNGPEGVEALDFYQGFLADGTGVYWGEEQGDQMAAFKDGRIGMFLNGPYVMGLLKSTDGAPEMSGQWKVALAPYSKEPGSYLGGTGLGIPVNARHKEAAWKFIEYMLRLEQELGVFTYAGAAPATKEALESSELTTPDPYFGGDAPFPVFLDTMSTATHFPYVKAWNDIDVAISDAVDGVLLGQSSSEEALDAAADEVNGLLAD